jgi:hypothetical protein
MCILTGHSRARGLFSQVSSFPDRLWSQVRSGVMFFWSNHEVNLPRTCNKPNSYRASRFATQLGIYIGICELLIITKLAKLFRQMLLCFRLSPINKNTIRSTLEQFYTTELQYRTPPPKKCNRNEKCWYILRPFGILYGHWEYFTVIWCILWKCGIVCCHCVQFFPVWYFVPRKSGIPGDECILHTLKSRRSRRRMSNRDDFPCKERQVQSR